MVGKPGKTPRPIVIASLTSRIVQRAILDVCQSDKPSIQKKLGLLPSLLQTPTSVGGLPNKGVKTAIEIIERARLGGATHYVRSDIQAFFTRISKQTSTRSLTPRSATGTSLSYLSRDSRLNSRTRTGMISRDIGRSSPMRFEACRKDHRSQLCVQT